MVQNLDGHQMKISSHSFQHQLFQHQQLVKCVCVNVKYEKTVPAHNIAFVHWHIRVLMKIIWELQSNTEAEMDGCEDDESFKLESANFIRKCFMTNNMNYMRLILITESRKLKSTGPRATCSGQVYLQNQNSSKSKSCLVSVFIIEHPEVI